MYKIVKNISRKPFLLVLILLFSSVFLIIQPEKQGLSNNEIGIKNIKTDLVTHDPIKIYSDASFVSFGFSGEGTESEPYVIENYYIATTEPYQDYGIQIQYVTKHFIIRNCEILGFTRGIQIFFSNSPFIIEDCYIEASSFAIDASSFSNSTLIRNNECKNTFSGWGIRCSSGQIENNLVIGVYDSAGIKCYNGTIRENTIQNCSIGIELGNFMSVVGNSISNCRTGISTMSHQNVTIVQNSISDTVHGIYYEDSYNTTIYNNTFIRNLQPLYSRSLIYYYRFVNFNISFNTFEDSILETIIHYCKFTILENNFFSQSDLAVVHCENLTLFNNEFQSSNIRYSNCLNTSVIDNEISDGGIEIYEESLEDYYNYYFENTLVNGKSIGLFLGFNALTIENTDYGQLILVNCTNILIQNNEISGTFNSIYLKYCNNILVQNNYLANNFAGIMCDRTDNLEIKTNTFENCIYGISYNYIFSYNAFRYINHNVTSLIITENIFIRSGFRFNPCYLYSTGHINDGTYEAHSDVIPMTITGNLVNGKKLGFIFNTNNLILDEEKYGQLILVHCKDISIRNQNLSYSSIGIELFNSTWITIDNCICDNNWVYGIYLRRYSDNATISRNICNDNHKDGILIEDSRDSNILKNQCCRNKNGISIVGLSRETIITYNLVENNVNYGINLGSSESNLNGYCGFNIVHHNTIIDNSGPLDPQYNPSSKGSQAYNRGNSIWYDNDTKKGNYWNDWNGTGPYIILAGEDGIDLYPLSRPTWPLGNPELYALFSLVLVIPLGVLIYKLVLKRKVV